MLPHTFPIKRRIKEKGSAGHKILEHIMGLEQERLVAGHEVRLRDEIGRSYRTRCEAQMRDGDRAGLLRVVNKIALREIAGVLADDFDRLLVRANRAVGAESEKLRAHDVVRLDREARIDIETGVRKVVVDADREMILR